MATNIIRTGDSVVFTAAGAVTSGDMVAYGDRVVIATISGTLGQSLGGEAGCIATVPKAAEDITQYEILYYDPVGECVTKTAGALARCGIAAESKLTAVATINCVFDPIVA